jgi:DNA-binding response OmpR family regulator
MFITNRFAAAEATTAARDSTSAICRILLVDDRPERRALVRAVVEAGPDAGIVVAEAASPASAHIALDQHQIDAVVMEIQLPVAAGLSLIASLRQADPKLVIVVCTFYADAVTTAQAREAGADAYLVKPVSIRELSGACRLRRPEVDVAVEAAAAVIA